MVQHFSPLSLRLRVAEFVIRLLLPLFGVGLLAAGLVGVVNFLLVPLADLFVTRDWVVVEARVESVRTEPLSKWLPLPVNRMVLRYSYMHDGQRYECGHYGPQQGLETRKRSNAFLSEVTSEPTIRVWLDPSSPDRATVQRQMSWALAALALPALALGFLGAMMVLASMMLWNDRRSLFRRRIGRDGRRLKEND